MPLGRDVAVEEDPAVRRMVVSPVKLHEPLVGQRGQDLRVPTGVQPVGIVREEAHPHVPLDQGIEVRVRPFHLVVDDPFYDQGTVRILGVGELEVIPFLHKMDLAQQRVEHGIAVHIGDVEKVLFVHAGAGVDGLVRVCHGVEKRRQACLEKLDKRVLHRVFPRAAQHCVLQNVREACVVRRRRRQRYGEEVLPILAVEMKNAGPALLVRKLVCDKLEIS